jgi:hypothetical protein
VPATIVTTPTGSWHANLTDAVWISQSTSGAQSPTGYADVFYRLQFYLDPSVDPSTFQLGLNLWADNSVHEVWINDQAQSGHPGVGTLPQSPANPYTATNSYGAASSVAAFTFANTPASTFWKTGLNTLIVDVKTGSPDVGLQAEVNGSSVCKRAPAGAAIPTLNPAALALLALAMLGLAAFGIKRRV